MTDSELQEHIEKSREVLALARIAYETSDYDESEQYARQAISLLESHSDRKDLGDEKDKSSQKHDIIDLLAHAYNRLNSICMSRAEYSLALEYASIAFAFSEQIGDKKRKSGLMSNIGSAHLHFCDYTLALEYFVKALSLSEEIDDSSGIANNLGNIGSVHFWRCEFNQALEYYAKALSLFEQHADKVGMAVCLGNIGNVHWNLSDFIRALEYHDKALGLAKELGNKASMVLHLGNIGNVYQSLSDFHKALDYLGKSLSLAEEIGYKAIVGQNLGNIGNVYQSLDDYPRALEYLMKALISDEELGDKRGVARHLGNIGNAYQNLSDYPRALEYYDKAVRLAEELDYKAAEASFLRGMGLVYGLEQDYVRSLEYLIRAMKLHVDVGMKSEAAGIKGHIGELYANAKWKEHDNAKAEEYLLDSIAASQELGTKNYDVHKVLAELYKRKERWKECQEQYEIYHELKDEVHSEEARKSAALLEQRKQIAENEKEIAIAQAAASAKLSATSSLLHRVLPELIATRMIDGEEIADYFTSVSILFADIAGFTPISADMPAIVVVRFLNFVFGEFDRIVKKHGCEKIKTIGDGYMAVCGAPFECADHAERLAAAALEMQETIVLPEPIRDHMPEGAELGIRIGLHTGSIIAGVIGEERFVYDVYSDAVNTAARMESQGVENKIHCSNDFYRHLQNRFAMTKNTTHGMNFVKRGEIEIKGKGLMRTYFLERA